MNNPRLAGRYAKSLLDLAVEQKQLDTVFADMKLLKQVCKGKLYTYLILASLVPLKTNIKGTTGLRN